MAFLDVTDLLDIQDPNATNEKRFSELGIVDLTADSGQFQRYISPTAQEQLKTTSELRSVQIPVIKDQDVEVVQTPGFNFIPANLPESDQYSFVAFDIFSGLRHYPAQYANNVIDEAFAKKTVIENVLYKMGQVKETIITTLLEQQKTQLLPNGQTEVSQGDGTYTFDLGTDTLEISKAAQKEAGMFENLGFLMDANELPGQYRIVTQRAGLSVQKTERLKYGMSNEKNLQAFPFGLDRMYESGNLLAGSDIFNGFFVRDGAIGTISNFPWDFRNSTEINGTKWSVSDTTMPWLRSQVNVFVNSQPTEATALVTAKTDTNLIMSHFSEMALWDRFYVFYRYNSDLATRSNDIVKIKGLTT